ncbi:MAG: glycosyltransferase family 39 protein [Cyanobacteria bacterium]|nr:glycosyltransferase family 39 protein [Cyanobacteriota bacterium]
MNYKLKIILFILVIGIASFLRLWQLGNIPPSPDWDEAALGYNAYSIMITGKDEYGKFLPIVLRSFDDYKPALYSYLAIPFIKIFGLNVFAVRMVSAFFGILTVIATYFLVKQILRISGNKNKVLEFLPITSAFLLAVSPWHIQFSRIAFESNVGVAFNVCAFLFFLIAIKNPKYFLLSFLFGALNIYIYQSEKVFTPLVFVSLIAIFRREIFLNKINKLYFALGVFLALVIVAPMLGYTIIDKNAMLRAKGVSVFSDQTQFLRRNVQKVAFDEKNKDVIGLILDNRRFEFVKAVIAGYISHFDLNWLFISGDIERHHAPYMGLLYLFELPFILIGVYFLVFGPFDRKIKIAIISYFLIVPIPASITSGVPHSVRTLNFLPIYQIFSGLGILMVIEAINRYRRFIIFLIFIPLLSIFILNIFYYLNQYFVQLNKFYSEDWQYGYKEATDYVKTIADRYDHVIVTNKAPLDQSYMFFLFYLKYDPKKYLSKGGTASGGFNEEHKGFANITFRPINGNAFSLVGKNLFVGRPGDFSPNTKVIKTINYLDGQPAIVIAE